MFYWEYTITYYDEVEVDGVDETRSGIVTGDNLSEVAEALENYYGDSIFEVSNLKMISEGECLDFNDFHSTI